MDETYDAIVLGTGLKVYLLFNGKFLKHGAVRTHKTCIPNN